MKFAKLATAYLASHIETEAVMKECDEVLPLSCDAWHDADMMPIHGFLRAEWGKTVYF